MKLIKSSNPLPVATIVLLTLFLTGCGALKITDSTASVTLHKVIRATRNAPIVVIKEREGGSILIESVDKRAGFFAVTFKGKLTQLVTNKFLYVKSQSSDCYSKWTPVPISQFINLILPQGKVTFNSRNSTSGSVDWTTILANKPGPETKVTYNSHYLITSERVIHFGQFERVSYPNSLREPRAPVQICESSYR
jgi:hypothetical protein